MKLQTALLIFGLMASAMAGDGMAADDFAQLSGTWTLADIGGRTVLAGRAELPNFTIAGTKVSGFDGCNSFSGSLAKPGAIAATRRGCKGAVLMLPLDLNRLGDHLKAGRLSNDSLEFPARGGFPASHFERRG